MIRRAAPRGRPRPRAGRARRRRRRRARAGSDARSPARRGSPRARRRGRPSPRRRAPPPRVEPRRRARRRGGSCRSRQDRRRAATEVRPASASCQRFRSQRSSRSRPAISGEPPSSWRGSSRGGGPASRAGSCRRIASWSSRSSGPGSTPSSLGERPVRGAVALHRFGLAPGAVEGEHALGVEALVGGVLCDQRLEAADRIVVASRRELGVDRELDRAQVKLLEPADLGAGERLLGDVRERGAAPQLERALCRPVGDSLLGLAPRTLDQVLEAGRVHRVLRQPELVASAVGDDARPRVVGGQCLAQLGDVVLDVLGGALRRAITPQAIDQNRRRRPCDWRAARASPAPLAACFP